MTSDRNVHLSLSETLYMMTSALFELMCDFIYSHRLARFLIIIRPVLKIHENQS